MPVPETTGKESSSEQDIADFGEDPIEKLKQWKQRKNIVESKRPKGSPKSPALAFCAWKEEVKSVSPEPFEPADIDILAERNYECILDMPDAE